MLCRTASDLYWAARNVERAENTARLIDVTTRIAMLPERLDRGKSESAPWKRALDALGVSETYGERYPGVAPVAQDVLRFLLLDPENPSSVYRCFQDARQNARAQRSAITSEMYEDLNASWLEYRMLRWDQVSNDGVSNLLEWIKRRSASFRGVTIGTLGRGPGYAFLQMGAFLERADWAIRLLDVIGSDAELPAAGETSDAVSYFQWSALLQSMSAFEMYRKLYRESVTPQRVTELMLLKPQNPRSLQTCVNSLHRVIRTLAKDDDLQVVRLAGALAAQSRYARIEDVIDSGLEPYLQDTMGKLVAVGEEINRQFMVSLDATQLQPATPGQAQNQSQSSQGQTQSQSQSQSSN